MFSFFRRNLKDSKDTSDKSSSSTESGKTEMKTTEKDKMKGKDKETKGKMDKKNKDKQPVGKASISKVHPPPTDNDTETASRHHQSRRSLTNQQPAIQNQDGTEAANPSGTVIPNRNSVSDSKSEIPSETNDQCRNVNDAGNLSNLEMARNISEKSSSILASLTPETFQKDKAGTKSLVKNETCNVSSGLLNSVIKLPLSPKILGKNKSLRNEVKSKVTQNVTSLNNATHVSNTQAAVVEVAKQTPMGSQAFNSVDPCQSQSCLSGNQSVSLVSQESDVQVPSCSSSWEKAATVAPIVNRPLSRHSSDLSLVAVSAETVCEFLQECKEISSSQDQDLADMDEADCWKFVGDMVASDEKLLLQPNIITDEAISVKNDGELSLGHEAKNNLSLDSNDVSREAQNGTDQKSMTAINQGQEKWSDHLLEPDVKQKDILTPLPPLPVDTQPETIQQDTPSAPSSDPLVPNLQPADCPPIDLNGTMERGSSTEINVLEDRIRELEILLQDKTQRLDELESAILEDGERLLKLETLERLETELREREQLDSERDEELRLLHEALEEALEEKTELESRLVRDDSRETQLLEDFEWKLHEIEKDYKKKITEAEKMTEERVKTEMATEYQRIVEGKRLLDEELNQIAHLKSYEAEVIQLRGLVHEQQRALRVASRQIEQLRINERLIQDDLNKVRTQGYTRKQQEELEQQLQEKMQLEKDSLRQQLITWHEDEVQKAVQTITKQKNEEMNSMKSQFDHQQSQLTQQVAELRRNLQQKDEQLVKQLEALRTAADRELWDLRRQLSKVQDSHAEMLDQLQRKHAEELEQCKLSNCREEIEKEYDEKLRGIEAQHQTQLNKLQNLIEEEKQEALTLLEEHYRGQLEALQEYSQSLQKKFSDSDHQNQQEIQRLMKMLDQRDEELLNLRQELNQLHENWPVAKTGSKDGSEDTAGSTPPIGRSAGDGRSPSSSPPTASNQKNYFINPSPSYTFRHSSCKNQPVDEATYCCNDPDHFEAQQMVLEMQQILADRDAELQRLTEEKRFYQLELIHWERNLAHQRGGLPLALMPDPSLVEACPSWKGFSAPPVTKPRLPEIYEPQIGMTGSMGSNESFQSRIYSPIGDNSPMLSGSVAADPVIYERKVHGCWLPRMDDLCQLKTNLYPMEDVYIADEDDDQNSSGFTTPLPDREINPFFALI